MSRQNLSNIIVGLGLLGADYLGRSGRSADGDAVLPIWFGAVAALGVLIGVRKTTGLRRAAFVVTAVSIMNWYYGHLVGVPNQARSALLALAGACFIASAMSNVESHQALKRTPAVWWIIAIIALAAIIFVV
jgi:hypothetical protein